jgi:hypothetical protein
MSAIRPVELKWVTERMDLLPIWSVKRETTAKDEVQQRRALASRVPLAHESSTQLDGE